jgi:hypothetical protein
VEVQEADEGIPFVYTHAADGAIARVEAHEPGELKATDRAKGAEGTNATLGVRAHSCVARFGRFSDAVVVPNRFPAAESGMSPASASVDEKTQPVIWNVFVVGTFLMLRELPVKTQKLTTIPAFTP